MHILTNKKWILPILFVCFSWMAHTACCRHTSAEENIDGIVDVKVDTPTDNTGKESVVISVDKTSFDFALYSENGKEMITSSDCRNSYKLDATTLKPGAYILNVIVDEDIYMKQVVVDNKL